MGSIKITSPQQDQKLTCSASGRTSWPSITASQLATLTEHVTTLTVAQERMVRQGACHRMRVADSLAQDSSVWMAT
jgi:hypothetical protein